MQWKAQNDVLELGRETERGQIYYFQAPSGKVYVGAADDVSGGDLEPDELSQGIFCNWNLEIMLVRYLKGKSDIDYDTS